MTVLASIQEMPHFETFLAVCIENSSWSPLIGTTLNETLIHFEGCLPEAPLDLKKKPRDCSIELCNHRLYLTV